MQGLGASKLKYFTLWVSGITLSICSASYVKASALREQVDSGARLLVDASLPVLSRGLAQASTEFVLPIDLDAWQETSQALDGKLRVGLGLGFDFTVLARVGQNRLAASPMLQNEGAFMRVGGPIGEHAWGQAGVGYLARPGAAARLSGSGAMQWVIEKAQVLLSGSLQYEQQMLGQQKPALLATAGVLRTHSDRLDIFLEGRISLFDHSGVRDASENFAARITGGVGTLLSPTWRLLGSCGVDHQTHVLPDNSSRRQWSLLPRIVLSHQNV